MLKQEDGFTTHQGITNASGYYVCDGSFEGEANYSFDWERYDFSIQYDKNQASYDGPKTNENWNVNIPRDCLYHFFASIFRPAYRYYYNYIRGLRRPPENSFWKRQMKIHAKYETNDGSNGSFNTWTWIFLFNWNIYIYNPTNNNVETYGSVIHELAHASHWNIDNSDFYDSEKRVKESWARGVQWELTRMIYPGFVGGYISVVDGYTPVVIDMIDNSSDNNTGNELIENVEGYTIRQIEDALVGITNWESWENNIKNMYNNGTEENLYELFDLYN